RKRRYSHDTRLTTLGDNTSASWDRRGCTASAGSFANRARRHSGHHERAYVAWRHGESDCGSAARDARVLHALGQAAAAVSKASLAAGDASASHTERPSIVGAR